MIYRTCSAFADSASAKLMRKIMSKLCLCPYQRSQRELMAAAVPGSADLRKPAFLWHPRLGTRLLSPSPWCHLLPCSLGCPQDNAKGLTERPWLRDSWRGAALLCSPPWVTSSEGQMQTPRRLAGSHPACRAGRWGFRLSRDSKKRSQKQEGVFWL